MAEITSPVKVAAKPRKKRHFLRKLLVALLIVVLLAAAALYAISSLKAAYTVTYKGYTASTGSISNALSFSGSLQLVNSETFAAGADTTVRAIDVSAGDEVKAGDRLLRLANGEVVKAGIDGRVNVISVEEGDSVLAGDSLIQIADFNHMKVNLRVDEYDIGQVAVGQACRVTATATERQFDSTIAAIDYISASTGNVAYYTATAYVDVDAGVYPGMQVTVTIPQEEAENVVVLSMDALSFDETNSAFVYEADADGTMIPVPVEVGVSNGSYVEIRSGLKAGDQVYAEVKTEAEASGLAELMSGMFGGQQVMPGSGMNRPSGGSGTWNRENGGFGGERP